MNPSGQVYIWLFWHNMFYLPLFGGLIAPFAIVFRFDSLLRLLHRNKTPVEGEQIFSVPTIEDEIPESAGMLHSLHQLKKKSKRASIFLIIFGFGIVALSISTLLIGKVNVTFYVNYSVATFLHTAVCVTCLILLSKPHQFQLERKNGLTFKNHEYDHTLIFYNYNLQSFVIVIGTDGACSKG